MQGIPLIASPPEQGDPNPHSHNIAHYQPPWKSLSEFGMIHDLDRLDSSAPQYQQLMQQVSAAGTV